MKQLILAVIIMCSYPAFGQQFKQGWTRLGDGGSYSTKISGVCPPTGGATFPRVPITGAQYTITAATWSGGTATLTLTESNHVVNGQTVAISGVTPSAYNSTSAIVTAVSGSTIQYAIASNPGTYTSGGVVGTSVDGSGNLYNYAFNCHGITSAWNSSILRSLPGSESMWTILAGGHGDYGGNEGYKLDLRAFPKITITRMTDPSQLLESDWNSLSDPVAAPDGRPTSRHLWDQIEYDADLDKAFLVNGGLYGNNGTHSCDSWNVTIPGLSWTREDPVNTTGGGFDPFANCSSDGFTFRGHLSYNPNDKVLYWQSPDAIFSYTPSTNKYVVLSTNAATPYAAGRGAIDPEHNRMWFIGSAFQENPPLTHASYINLSGSPNYNSVDFTSSLSGCSGIMANSNNSNIPTTGIDQAFPGMEWNYALHKFVIYVINDGNRIWTFDPTTGICTNSSPSGGPGTSQNSVGIFGNLRCARSLDNACILMDSYDQDWWVYSPNAPAGLGSSTYNCLDFDGDGYGVGPGCLGLDADDLDATVHTASQAFTAHGGTYVSFLSYQGYHPTHIWYLAPASSGGSDSNNCEDSVSSPCATYAHISSAVNTSAAACEGPAVVMRQGFNDRLTPPSGCSGKPVLLLSYPAEQAVLDGTVSTNIVNAVDTAYLTIDGLKIINQSNIGFGTTDSQTSITSHDITIQHVDGGSGGGLIGPINGFNGIDNTTIQYNVLHDNDCSGGSCQHGIYLGARNYPAHNVVIRRNISYNNDWEGIHWNGRCFGCTIEQNWIHDVGVGCISVQEGFTNGYIRNNTCTNPANFGIQIYNYPGDCPSQGGTSDICPYDQTGNLIANNSIFISGNISSAVTSPGSSGESCPTGITWCNHAGIEIANKTSPLAGSLGNNIFVNNISVNYGYIDHYPSIATFEDEANGAGTCGTQCLSWLSTAVFDNNLGFHSDGNGGNSVIGVGHAFGYQLQTCASATSFTTISNCQVADPKYVSASRTAYNTPSSYNLKLLSGSPALNSGMAGNGVPIYDITSATFDATPNLGAFTGTGSSLVVGTGVMRSGKTMQSGKMMTN